VGPASGFPQCHVFHRAMLESDEAVPVGGVHAQPLERCGRCHLPSQGLRYLQFKLLDVGWQYTLFRRLGELLDARRLDLLLFGRHVEARGCYLLHLHLLWLLPHPLSHHVAIKLIHGYLACFSLHLEVGGNLLHAVNHISSVKPALTLALVLILLQLVSLLYFAFHQSFTLLNIDWLP